MFKDKSFFCAALYIVLVIFVNGGFGNDSDKLIVHIIPHSHCDPGWLQTYEGYYSSYVERILTGVTNQLINDPKKTFIWAEISFFKLWWESQSLEHREKVKELVKKKQFEFVGGGWVQNDEGCASVDAIINQITEGNEYLLKYFNFVPRIAWQVDPFGHSSLTPTLFSQIGYEALVINRIHHQLKSAYKNDRDMEFIWRASPSVDNEIFTHVLHTHYAAPIGYDWEEGSPQVSDGNVEQRASEFVQSMKSRSMAYKTRHLLTAWGDDFKFQNAEFQFSNMDRLMRHINSKSDEYGVIVKYSTLSIYFDDLKDYINQNNAIQFPVYHGDFFPYADNEDSYWTGYYTSRPVLKAMHRETLSMLRSTEIVHAFNRVMNGNKKINWDHFFQRIQQARWDSSLVSHHDGITGTSKSYVVADYLSKLENAHIALSSITKMSTVMLMARDKEFEYAEDEFAIDNRIIDLSEGSESVALFFYNPLGWIRKQVVSVRVSTSNVQVQTANGTAIPVQVNQVWAIDSSGVKDVSETSQFELFFEVTLPPLGIGMYFVTKGKSSVTKSSVATLYSPRGGSPMSSVKKLSSEKLSIENEYFKIELGSNGFVKSVYDKVRVKSTALEVKYHEYQTERSGAYIFRSNSGASPVSDPVQIHVLKGSITEEVQIYGTHYRMIIRLYKNIGKELGKLIDFVHIVSPSSIGRELIVRYSSDLNSGTNFFTDNGMEMLQRTINSQRSETNYYPTQGTISIQDDSQQISVVGKLPMGSSSDKSGSIELMMHRSLQQDDGRGLGEAVTDSTFVKNRQFLLFDDIEEVEDIRRKVYFHLEHPIRIVYSLDQDTIENWNARFTPIYCPLIKPLPENIHVQSLRIRDMSTDDVVVKFMNFWEAKGDESVTTRSGVVQIDKLFSVFDTQRARYVSITLNRDYDELQKVEYPASGKQLANLHGLPPYEPNAKVEAESQNSLEKGVFISKVALEAAEKNKLQQLEPAGQRKLMEISDVDPYALSIYPIQVRSVLMRLNKRDVPVNPIDDNVPQSTHPVIRKERPKKHKPTAHKDFLIIPHEGEHVGSNELRVMALFTVAGTILLFFVYRRLSSSRKRLKLPLVFSPTKQL